MRKPSSDPHLKGISSRERDKAASGTITPGHTTSGRNVAQRIHGAPNISTPKGGSPLDLMLPYQRKYHDDTSRFKAWVASRQIGKSFTSAAEPVEDCWRASLGDRKATWITLSAGERQALEWLEKAKQWTEAFQLHIEEIVDKRDSAEALLKAAEIRFPGGSRIIALPANPATARGYSGNLTLDEFAFHEQPDEIWRATFPIITNPLRGELKLRVLSTPNGTGNKFHQIVKENKRFSVHTTTIHDAIAGGLQINIDELKEGLGDPEAWEQEYECNFLDTASVLLGYDLIAQNEAPEASQFCAPDYWQNRSTFPIDIGIDFGRKKDITCCWSAEKVADLQITKEVLELRKLPTPEQVEILSPRIARARRVCLDYTGPGVGLGDYLVEKFGEYNPDQHRYGKIELVTFTNTIKVELFAKLRIAFERRNWRIPAARVIREDLHSVYRFTTPTGAVTYRAAHTEDGHADRATAIALCNRAGAQAGGAAVTATVIT